MRVSRVVSVAVVMLAILVTPRLRGQEPVADDPPTAKTEPRDLSDRLDALERQNESLRNRLRDLETRPGLADALPKPPLSSSKPKMTGVWNNGLFFSSPDKDFEWSIGGTVQFDMGWYTAPQSVVDSVGVMNGYVDPALALQDGMDFRRARLRMQGQMYQFIEWYAQYDFASTIDLRRRTLGILTPEAQTLFDLYPGDPTQFNEVYLGITDIPVVGTFRAGHHREALNFVTGTAARNLAWMERGLLFDAFNGDFNFGSGLTLDNNYLDGRVYYWLAFLQNNSRSFTSVGDGAYVYDIRLTGLPIWDEDEQLWVHVGVDYSYRNLTLNQTRFRARPMIRVGHGFQVPNIVDTGLLFSRDAQQIVNLEFASAWGPWTFSMEGATSWVSNVTTGAVLNSDGTLPKGATYQGNFQAYAGYVELLRFLTPDHRGYRKERPGYDRVIPQRNFFVVDPEDAPIWNRGAWEIGIRYDFLDLTSAGINGGVGQAGTVCLNWYLNPNTRIQANYFVMHRHFESNSNPARVDGTLQGLGIRFNIDF